MEDKRIIKSKKNLKRTLIHLLSTSSFEKISVSELCRAGDTSRITFYKYYEDKYALADEMFSDYVMEADIDYHRLEALNNPDRNVRAGYLNLLQCILNLYSNNSDFFSHATPFENPYLYSAFYRHVFSSVKSYIERHNNGFKSKYPSKQTAALLCNGIWGVINECFSLNTTSRQVHNDILQMYCDILDSSIFISSEKTPRSIGSKNISQ